MRQEPCRIRSWRFTRRLVVKLVFLPFTALAVFLSVYLRTSPFEPEVAVRHLFAAKNCEMARIVGLAPARRGEPGYHAKHDADGDGIACAPVPAGGAEAAVQSRGGAKFLRP